MIPGVLYLDAVHVSDCSLVVADVQVRCQCWMQVLFMIPVVLYLDAVNVSDCSLVCSDVPIRGQGWM